MIDPRDEQAIRAAAFEFRKISLMAETLFEALAALSPWIKKRGLAEIKNLKKAAQVGPAGLKKALKGYNYRPDVFNYVPPSWVTAFKKFDDCDGSAFLIAEVFTGGRIYCIVEVDGGEIRNFEQWHFVYHDQAGGVWSNFRYKGHETIQGYARKYNSRYTHLVWVTKKIQIRKILEG